MKIGLVGLPGAGKSTLFSAMTREAPDPNVEYGKSASKIVTVPDERLALLRDIFKPKKFTLSGIEVHDFPGIDRTAAKGNSKMMAAMREMDAVAIVLRTFEDPSYPHDRAKPAPRADWDDVMTDFQIADLEMIERRVEKLEKAVTRPTKTQEQDRKELELLKKCQDALDGGGLLSQVELKSGEDEILGGFRFLTQKPVMAVLNLDDDANGADGFVESLSEQAENTIALRGSLEAEIAQLDEEEAREFMKDFDIAEPALVTMIRSLFHLLGLQSFFTVGPDEVRAWTISNGDSAVTAASKIHSDIARGFIRAEVMPYPQFIEAGDEKAAKAANIMRLEGKEYAVADGDIINFRFSV